MTINNLDNNINKNEELLKTIIKSNYGMDKIVLLKGENLNNEIEKIIEQTLTYYNYDSNHNDYIKHKESIKQILIKEFEIIDSNNGRLTSENIEDIAEYIIIKEMKGHPLMYHVEYDDKISQKQFENIYSNVGIKNLYDVVEDEIMELCYDDISEQRSELTKYILNKYGDKEELKQNYYDMFDKLMDVNYNTLDYIVPVDEIISQTRVDEITFYLKGKHDTIEDTAHNNRGFTTGDLERLKDNLEYEDFNSIAYLIQSQEYEVKDLFDDKKVENSEFLQSLKKNLEYCKESGIEILTPSFTYTDCNLQEVLDYLDESTRSVTIYKDSAVVNLTDPFGGGVSYYDIILEKDLSISKDNIEMYNSYIDENIVGLEQITDGFESKGRVVLSDKEVINEMKELDCTFIDKMLETLEY